MIVFINRFTVTGDPGEFERVFAETAAYLTQRPGFVRYHLVRSADNPLAYANVAEWETAVDLRAAIRDPQFEEHARRLRALATGEPQFYEVVAEYGRSARPVGIRLAECGDYSIPSHVGQLLDTNTDST